MVGNRELLKVLEQEGVMVVIRKLCVAESKELKEESYELSRYSPKDKIKMRGETQLRMPS